MTKEPCQQTRTDTAADRPLDAEKRRDTPNPSETHSPSSAFWPRQSRARRQIEPPTRLDRKHDRHTRTTGGQLTCCRSVASAGCPSCQAHPSSNYLRRLRRRPRRQPAVSAAARACRPLQRRPKPPPQPPRSRRRSATRRNWCRQLDLAVCQSETEPSASSMQSNTERTAFSQITPLPGVVLILNELRS